MNGLSLDFVETKRHAHHESAFKDPRSGTTLQRAAHFNTTHYEDPSQWKPINPKLAIYGSEYATPYSRNVINYESDGKFIVQACTILTASTC